MRYIKIEEYINGAHENFVTEIEISTPEGYALIPDEIEIPSTFPFVNVELDENNVVKKLIPVSVFNIDISPLRNQKLEEVSDKCSKAIVAGCDVTLENEAIKHFSMEETDQINIATALDAVNNGMKEYPYHADGELCELYSANNIKLISNAFVQHKLYHLTYCNHLMSWIKRCNKMKELKSIYYGIELPNDLKENMEKILKIKGSDIGGTSNTNATEE